MSQTTSDRGQQPERLWRRIAVTAIAAAVLTAAALPAAAQPTCSDVESLDIEVHGQHVVRDYVVGNPDFASWPPAGKDLGKAVAGQGAALPGGPGPAFHFANDIPPGASFCNEQAQSPGSPGPH